MESMDTIVFFIFFSFSLCCLSPHTKSVRHKDFTELTLNSLFLQRYYKRVGKKVALFYQDLRKLPRHFFYRRRRRLFR